jgi:hypothetical protein
MKIRPASLRANSLGCSNEVSEHRQRLVGFTRKFLCECILVENADLWRNLLEAIVTLEFAS